MKTLICYLKYFHQWQFWIPYAQKFLYVFLSHKSTKLKYYQHIHKCAELKLILTGSSMLKFNLEDTLPRLTTSICMYQFTCSCEVRFTGRTFGQLRKRIKEHHPVGLTKVTISTIRSSIVKHLVHSNHLTNNEKSFKILYTTPVNQYHSTRLKYLNMAEAILINLYKPELCSQKKSFSTMFYFLDPVYSVEFFPLYCLFYLVLFYLVYLIIFNGLYIH